MFVRLGLGAAGRVPDAIVATVGLHPGDLRVGARFVPAAPADCNRATGSTTRSSPSSTRGLRNAPCPATRCSTGSIRSTTRSTRGSSWRLGVGWRCLGLKQGRLGGTGAPTRQAPPNQVRLVPNLIRAAGDSRRVASRDLREPDSRSFTVVANAAAGSGTLGECVRVTPAPSTSPLDRSRKSTSFATTVTTAPASESSSELDN